MSFLAACLRISSGPLVWALHFAAIYGFAALACARGLAAGIPWVVALSTLAAAAACIHVLGREMKRGDRFVSWLGSGLAAFALLAIVWEATPILVVKPCA